MRGRFQHALRRMDAQQPDASRLRLVPPLHPRGGGGARPARGGAVTQYRPGWEEDHVHVLLSCRARLAPLRAGAAPAYRHPERPPV